MSNFKVGDTVQLKSSGPIMTIARIKQVDEREMEGGLSIGCQWFVKQEVRTGSFHPDVLEPADTSASVVSFLPERA